MTSKIRVLLVALVAVGAFAGASSSALALTVLNPGTFTGTASGGTTLTDTASGQVITCSGSTIIDKVVASGASSITSINYSGCSNSILGTINVAQSVSPWTDQIIADTTTSGHLQVTVPTNGATISNSSCNFTVAGTINSTVLGLGGVLGTLNKVVFNAATGLNVGSSVSGICALVVSPGDASTYTGTYTISPAIQIHS